MDKVKKSKKVFKVPIFASSNSKAPINVKRHLLTSDKVNDVTKRASRDENGNVTPMAHGA